MPPEIGLLALVFAIPAFILGVRTRRDLFGGRRFGRHPLFGADALADPALDRLTQALERMEASQRDLSRRLENLETIVTSDGTRTGPQIAIPPAEPTAADEAARLAQRLRA